MALGDRHISRAKRRLFTALYMNAFPLDKRAIWLINYYKRFRFLKQSVSLHSVAFCENRNFWNRCNNADILATVISMSNKLDFIFDPGVFRLLQASTKKCGRLIC